MRRQPSGHRRSVEATPLVRALQGSWAKLFTKSKDGHVVIFKRPLPDAAAEISAAHQSA